MTAQNITPTPPPKPPSKDPEDIIRIRAKHRRLMVRDHFEQNVYLVLVYGMTILSEAIVFGIITFFLKMNAGQFKELLLLVDAVGVIAFLAAMLTSVVHIGFSAWAQIQLDWKLFKMSDWEIDDKNGDS
jgi:hypothetical protein